MEESKVCTKCNEEKPLKMFYKHKETADGHEASCKSCRTKKQKELYKAKAAARCKQTNEYRKRNKDKYKEYARAWREKNPEAHKQHYEANKEYYKAKKAKRRASKLKRTPKWADLAKIREVYQNCPKNMEVDHIIPLQGENVSGLHVAANLQYLTPEENRSKSNKFDLEYNAN